VAFSFEPEVFHTFIPTVGYPLVKPQSSPSTQSIHSIH